MPLMQGLSSKKALGIYLHIPFCQVRCLYCDFAVYLDHKKKYFDLYLEALSQEISERIDSDDLEEYSLKSIFIGGGTPTILEIRQLEKVIQALRDKFKPEDQVEFTIEANPENLDYQKLNALRSLGINRLSIGVQSFSAKLLKRMARMHTNQQVFELFYAAEKAGFDNLSLDLIFGLPEQSFEDWVETLDLALDSKFKIKHLSAYLLTVEKNTPFFRLYQNSSHPVFPVEETIQNMYKLLQEKAKAKNFLQYEISNFAKPQFESIHNLGYWKNQEFLGFGLSAHEYFQGVRQRHTRKLNEYLKEPLRLEKLESDLATEELFLALRTSEGLDLKKYAETYQIDLLEKKTEFIEKALEKKLLRINDHVLQITPENLLISNEIILNLI